MLGFISGAVGYLDISYLGKLHVCPHYLVA